MEAEGARPKVECWCPFLHPISVGRGAASTRSCRKHMVMWVGRQNGAHCGFTNIYIYIYIYIYNIYIYIYYIYMPIQMFMHLCSHVACLNIYIYMYICMCIYIYIFIHRNIIHTCNMQIYFFSTLHTHVNFYTHTHTHSLLPIVWWSLVRAEPEKEQTCSGRAARQEEPPSRCHGT